MRMLLCCLGTWTVALYTADAAERRDGGAGPRGEVTSSAGEMACGGRVVLGGDDFDCHGFFFNGDVQAGWFIIGRSMEYVADGMMTDRRLIVCLGCNASQAVDGFEFAFELSSLPDAGWESVIVSGTDALADYFANRGPVTIDDTGIVYMPTVMGQVPGGITPPELDALDAHAIELALHVQGGGGLIAHSQSVFTRSLREWPRVLFKDIEGHSFSECTPFPCNYMALVLTPFGIENLPGVEVSTVLSSTPWHDWFSGAPLTPMITSVAGDPVVMGGPGGDCNANDICDVDEIATGRASDCDANGIIDECQLTTLVDCNANDIVDVCEVADGGQPDCNRNGIPDACDLEASFTLSSPVYEPLDQGFVAEFTPPGTLPLAASPVTLTAFALADFNLENEFITIEMNGVRLGDLFVTDAEQCPETPDSAELEIPAAVYNTLLLPLSLGTFTLRASEAVDTSCTHDSFLTFQLTYRLAGSDCNANEIPDECELDVAADCNEDDVLDVCQLSSDIVLETPWLGPLFSQLPQSFTFPQGPVANSDVTLFFRAFGDLGAPNEHIEVELNGVSIGTVFEEAGTNCPLLSADGDVLTLAAEEFNTVVEGTVPVLTMTPSAPVDPHECSGSRIAVVMSYVSSVLDCDENGRLDSCELADGGADCDTDGVLDVCQLAAGTIVDCDANGQLDRCELEAGIHSDCDGNKRPDVCDIADGAADCDADDIPDACQINEAPHLDCDGNQLIDSCELADGTGADCDGNGRLDSCDVQDGATDCDMNGTLDVCDLAEGAPDCNRSGVPDRCEIAAGDCNGDDILDTCQLTSKTDCDGDGVLDSCVSGADCNGNGRPDTCDLADGAPDCNRNERPDVCDLADGTSADCNGDNVPDECGLSDMDCDGDGVLDPCQIADRPGVDCDGNGRPDACDLTGRDCNDNDRLDVCEIADGRVPDCNDNGVPDVCETTPVIELTSDTAGPIDGRTPVTMDLGSVPVAGGAVQLVIEAVADVGNDGEFMHIELNGIAVGAVFVNEGMNCPGVSTQGLIVPQGLFNSTVGRGSGTLAVTARPTTSVSGQCRSSIQIRLSYAGVTLDCNSNGQLDACELAAGAVEDCNGNHVPDACEMNMSARYSSEMISPVGAGHDTAFVIAAPAAASSAVEMTVSARADLGSQLEFIDIELAGETIGRVFQTDAEDCPAQPNVTMLTIDASTFNAAAAEGQALVWLQPSNGVNADECTPSSSIVIDIAYDGPTLDCDGNGRLDSCDIAEGHLADDNGNGVPDNCESVVVLSSTPPDGAIDARSPFEPGTTKATGWSHIDLHLVGDVATLAPEHFEILSAAEVVPTIQSVSGADGNARVQLSGPIPVGACTLLRHTPTGFTARLTYHPADVNGDGQSNPADILALIDDINGVFEPALPVSRCDIDRSDACSPLDILTLIDLLNGAESNRPWNGTVVLGCP